MHVATSRAMVGSYGAKTEICSRLCDGLPSARENRQRIRPAAPDSNPSKR